MKRHRFVAGVFGASLAFAMILGCPVFGASPKASLTGPATVQSGDFLYLHFTGTVTDSKIILKAQSGPDQLVCTVLYLNDEQGNYIPALGMARPTIPGSYQFLLVAVGTPAGATSPSFDAATWAVTVVAPAPPTPPPTPDPPPNPSPSPYIGKLWGMLVLPDTLTVDLSAIRTDPKLRNEMSARSIDFQTHQQSEDALKAPTWQANIQHFGGAPVVLWMDANKKIVQATKSMSVDDIVADARKIRGK